MVLDLKELQGLMDQARIVPSEPLPELLTVTCSIGSFSDSKPTCAEVSRTYPEAAGPREMFLVMVQRPNRDDPECTALFDASGKELPLDAAEFRFDPTELPQRRGHERAVHDGLLAGLLRRGLPAALGQPDARAAQ